MSVAEKPRKLIPPAPRLLTCDEFMGMVEAGIIDEDERVELIEGVIYDMSPIGPRHSSAIIHLIEILGAAAKGRYLLSAQSPAVVSNRSQPQPDLMLLKARRDRYRGAHPGPADILLVVEVADSSLEHDRGVKAPLYAKSAIAEYWLIDVVGRTVEVHRKPSAKGYRSVERVTRRGSVSPLAFPDIVIPLRELFP